MPVLNEASALAVLLPELPEALRACTTVVDNGSNDGSAVVAAQFGVRVVGAADPGALPMHARFGNWLATGLIRQITGIRYTDLGPLRALRFAALRSLQMQDRNFGWTVEMQMKAARLRLRICEVPVHYRKRVGTSKISGTVSGSLRAGFSILHTIALHGR
jgi:hypothetical protein